ncbi:hypothetical protein L1887_42452 [Cichorium endivia]|nr:hypothetical protein L1887_42452 [Cichorium endivia]
MVRIRVEGSVAWGRVAADATPNAKIVGLASFCAHDASLASTLEAVVIATTTTWSASGHSSVKEAKDREAVTAADRQSKERDRARRLQRPGLASCFCCCCCFGCMRRRIQGDQGPAPLKPPTLTPSLSTLAKLRLRWVAFMGHPKKGGLSNTLPTRWRSLPNSHFSKEAHEQQQQQQQEEEEEKMKPPGRHDAKLPEAKALAPCFGKAELPSVRRRDVDAAAPSLEGSSNSEQLGFGGCRWWLR